MEIKDDESALREFLLDIECLDELNPWLSSFNLFDVLKITKNEIRHSNMLAWLLTASENHGLGDQFIKAMIQKIVENDVVQRHDIFSVLLMDLYSFVVYREWKNIDLLLVSEEEKYLIAIENKVGSHEHSNQLKRYRRTLESDFPEYQKTYIFLTPDGEEPSENEYWEALTYQTIEEVIMCIIKKNELLPDVELIIKNYIEVIRRDIVKDEKLIEVCNKIYTKHKRALDLIFESRPDEYSKLSYAIKSELKDLATQGIIIFQDELSSNRYIKFNTPSMNKYLSEIEENNSSWNSKQIYYYWFYLTDTDKININFELGGFNVPGDQMSNMQMIINTLKPEDRNKSQFKYKRLLKSRWYKIDEMDETEDIMNKVKLAVQEILNLEKKLFEELGWNWN